MTIVLDNGALQVSVDDARGGEVRYLGRPGGRNWLASYDWPAAPPTGDPVTDWLGAYRGGWQELFPNVGAPCVVGGTPLPFHGESSVQPWELLRSDGLALTLRFRSRLPLEVVRRMWLDPSRPVLRLQETVRHRGAVGDVPYLWAHHPAFATRPRDRIDVPGGRIVSSADAGPPDCDLRPGASSAWPLAVGADGSPVDLRVVPPDGVRRLCVIDELPAAWAALRRPEGDGIALAWDLRTYPRLWLWQELAVPGPPWDGRARITALEPQGAVRGDGLAAHDLRGEAPRLSPGGVAGTWLTLSLFAGDGREVVAVARDGTVALRAPHSPTPRPPASQRPPSDVPGILS